MNVPWKEFKSLTIDYALSGASAATLTFWTNPDGQSPVIQRTVALQASGGLRTTATFDFDQSGLLPEGTLYKVRVTTPSGATLKLFGGTLSWRPFGVYLAQNQAWETPASGVGN